MFKKKERNNIQRECFQIYDHPVWSDQNELWKNFHHSDDGETLILSTSSGIWQDNMHNQRRALFLLDFVSSYKIESIFINAFAKS